MEEEAPSGKHRREDDDPEDCEPTGKKPYRQDPFSCPCPTFPEKPLTTVTFSPKSCLVIGGGERTKQLVTGLPMGVFERVYFAGTAAAEMVLKVLPYQWSSATVVCSPTNTMAKQFMVDQAFSLDDLYAELHFVHAPPRSRPPNLTSEEGLLFEEHPLDSEEDVFFPSISPIMVAITDVFRTIYVIGMEPFFSSEITHSSLLCEAMLKKLRQRFGPINVVVL